MPTSREPAAAPLVCSTTIPGGGSGSALVRQAAKRTRCPSIQGTLLALTVCILSCTHMPQNQSRVWDFGQPGPGKICVVIFGDVKYPGRYYLDGGANLDSVMSVFGGWGGHGDFGGAPPRTVTLQRERDGKIERVNYRFIKMSASERQAVRLSDGDMLIYRVTIL